MKPQLFEKVLHVPSVSHEEWLAYRKTGIGGSDAGAICGLDPFSSPFTVYAEKRELIPAKEDNEAMRQGRDFEGYVAWRFCAAEGKKVQRFGWLIRSKQYPWAFADVDRVVVGENAILECKTTSSRNPSDFANGEIPRRWYCQTLHYLAVTGCDVCYLAVIVLGKAYYCFRVERDEKEIEALMAIEKAFWHNNVEADVPPSPDGSETASAVIGAMFHQSAEEGVADLTPYARELEEYRRIRAEAAALEERSKQIEQSIKLFLADLPKGTGNGVSVSWKTQTRRTVDAARLKAELPEIYEKYLKESVVRPFKINFSEDTE